MSSEYAAIPWKSWHDVQNIIGLSRQQIYLYRKQILNKQVPGYMEGTNGLNFASLAILLSIRELATITKNINDAVVLYLEMTEQDREKLRLTKSKEAEINATN